MRYDVLLLDHPEPYYGIPRLYSKENCLFTLRDDLIMNLFTNNFQSWQLNNNNRASWFRLAPPLCKTSMLHCSKIYTFLLTCNGWLFGTNHDTFTQNLVMLSPDFFQKGCLLSSRAGLIMIMNLNTNTFLLVAIHNLIRLGCLSQVFCYNLKYI